MKVSHLCFLTKKLFGAMLHHMVLCNINCSIQAKIKSIKSKLSEALHSSEDQSPLVLDPGSAILSNSKAMGDGMDSPVTTNLEEELKKRDALIEVCYSTIIP